MTTTPTAPYVDTALTDHLTDARRHLLAAYVACSDLQRDAVGALINDVDQALTDALAVTR